MGPWPVIGTSDIGPTKLKNKNLWHTISTEASLADTAEKKEKKNPPSTVVWGITGGPH